MKRPTDKPSTDTHAALMRTEWPRLTGDDFAATNGDHDLLLRRLQMRYGWKPDEAQAELRRLIERRLTV